MALTASYQGEVVATCPMTTSTVAKLNRWAISSRYVCALCCFLWALICLVQPIFECLKVSCVDVTDEPCVCDREESRSQQGLEGLLVGSQWKYGAWVWGAWRQASTREWEAHRVVGRRYPKRGKCRVHQTFSTHTHMHIYVPKIYIEIYISSRLTLCLQIKSAVSHWV